MAQDRRRRDEDGEGKRSQVRRLPLHRHPRQGAARHRAGVGTSTKTSSPSGHAFDGSSIAGWKGIEASDMLLMPDPNTANIDPFFEEPTLILTCDVLEPGDGKPYERDPRSLAKRAEAYLKASGLGDAAFFGPEPEFFIFDQRALERRHVGLLRQDRVRRSRLEHRQGIRARQLRLPPGGQGRLLPGAAGRQLPGHALRDVPDPRVAGHPGRGAPPRSRRRRPEGARHQVLARWCSAPTGCSCRST